MRTGVISDIHGNYSALQQVMRELEKLRCDEIICLGDVVGYYPMVNACIDLIQRNGIRCLEGNHETFLLGLASCGRSRSVNQCIEYQKKVITPENLQWIAGLAPELRTERFFAVHGGWDDPVDEYVVDFDFDKLLQRFPGCKLFLSGHTHIQKIQRQGDCVYFNPGSVGQPRDHDPRAAFGIIDDGEVRLFRTAYDIDRTARVMADAGFPEYFYSNLYYGLKIGEKIPPEMAAAGSS